MYNGVEVYLLQCNGNAPPFFNTFLVSLPAVAYRTSRRMNRVACSSGGRPEATGYLQACPDSQEASLPPQSPLSVAFGGLAGLFYFLLRAGEASAVDCGNWQLLPWYARPACPGESGSISCRPFALEVVVALGPVSIGVSMHPRSHFVLIVLIALI